MDPVIYLIHYRGSVFIIGLSGSSGDWESCNLFNSLSESVIYYQLQQREMSQNVSNLFNLL